MIRKYRGTHFKNHIKQCTEAYGPMHRKKVPKKQKESILQRDIVKALLVSKVGYFFRIRNGATFDPRAGIHRANTAEKGIPDILGLTDKGRFVAIEVKYLEKVEDRKKITFVVKLRDEQKSFLQRVESLGGVAGVAYTVQDSIDIIQDKPLIYPRHPRTYGHKEKEWRARYEVDYRRRKKALVLLKERLGHTFNVYMINRTDLLELQMLDLLREFDKSLQSSS